MILLVKHDVRNSPDLKIRESPIGVDKKGPINGLAKNPHDFFTFVLAKHSDSCPFNMPTLFEHFC
jgi:hypothetical protein